MLAGGCRCLRYDQVDLLLMLLYNDYWLQLKLLLEIRISHALRFVFCPGVQSHFLDQAQIKDFGIMWLLGSLICIRMKMVAGEIIAVTAKADALLLNASIDVARLGHTKESDFAALVPTSLAHCLFFGNPKSLGYHCPELFILISQIHGAIEAIQATRCCHLLVVHRILLSFS